HCRRVLEINPQNFDAHICLALAFLAADRREDAGRICDAALVLRPQAETSLNELAILLMRLVRLPQALGTLDHALALRPAFVPALINRGQVLELLGRYDGALASFAAAQRADPTHVGA